MVDLILKVGAVVGAVALLLLLLWYVQRLLANVRLASSEVWTPVMLAAAEAAGAAAETAATKAAQSTVNEAVEARVSRAVEAAVSKLQPIAAPMSSGYAPLPEAAGAMPVGGMPPETGAQMGLPAMPPMPPMPERSRMPVIEEMTPQDEHMQQSIAKLAEEEPTTIADIIHMWLSEDERGNA